jgi:hypothetical protein
MSMFMFGCPDVGHVAEGAVIEPVNDVIAEGDVAE